MIHSPESSSDLLAEWRWLLGGHVRLAGWSSSGDLFVTDARGSVSRLDTGAGELELVAASGTEFQRMLSDPARADDLLLLSVVHEFEQRHGALRPGECLGFTTLPILGGAYTIENRFRLRVAEHAAVSGDLHRQLRDLPDGTSVSIKIIP
jgi:hypothetical protein